MFSIPSSGSSEDSDGVSVAFMSLTSRMHVVKLYYAFFGACDA